MNADTTIFGKAFADSIYLRWATRADISAIAKIFHAFLSTFEFQDHCAPRRNEKPEEFYLFCLARVRMFFCKRGARVMVAERLVVRVTGEERQVLGFSVWDAQGDSNCIRKEWIKNDETWARALERQLVDLEVKYHRYCRNTIFDYAAFGTLWGRLEAAYHGIDSLKNNMHLQLLAVDPAWQKGSGVGRRLMQWGIEVSREMNLPIVIESSAAGYPFYLKMGCKRLTTVRIDLIPEKAYDKNIMVYEPRTETGEIMTS